MTTVLTNLSTIICALVRFSNGTFGETNSLMIASFGVMAVNGFFAILVSLGGLVSVFIKSKEIKKGSKMLEISYNCRKERKWARRYWKSCNVIKIKFGESNFLEELTPLKSLHFSLDLTVQFLLLSAHK